MKKFINLMSICTAFYLTAANAQDIITPPQLDENSSYISTADDNLGNTYLLYQDGSDTAITSGYSSKRGQLLKYDGDSWSVVESYNSNTTDNLNIYINETGTELRQNEMVVDSKNKLHIVYLDYSVEYDEPTLAYQRYNSRSKYLEGWESQAELNSAWFSDGLDGSVSFTPLAKDLALDINSSDTPIVAYIKSDDDNVVVRYLNDKGTVGTDDDITNFQDDTWDTLGTLTLTSSEIDMVIDRDIPYLAYKENNGGKLSVLKYQDSKWEIFDANISNGEVSKIKLSVQGDDNLYLSYVEDNTTAVTLKLRRYKSLNIDEESTNSIISLKPSNGTDISYSLAGIDKELFTISNDGNLSFTSAPSFESDEDNNSDGVYELDVTIKDNDTNLSSYENFNISLNDIDEAPKLDTISNITKDEDSDDFNITLNGTDEDSDSISYTVKSSDSSKVTVAIVNGKIVVTPIANANGTITVEVNATSNGLSTIESFDVILTSVNDLPMINTTFDDINISEDSGTKSFDINISDIDGDDLNITIKSSDENILTVNSNSTKKWLNQASYSKALDFNLTTVKDANGEVHITIKVEDANGAEVWSEFYVDVIAVNDAPTVMVKKTDIHLFKNFEDKNITLIGKDIDSTNLTYSAVANDESVVDLNITNNILTLKSKPDISGKSDINITVNDGELNGTTSFNVTVFKSDTPEDMKGDIDINTTKNDDTNVTHTLTIGNYILEAISEINTTTTQTDDGVETIYSDIDRNISVVATISDGASHSLKKGGVETKAISTISGTKTVIKKDYSIETSATVGTDSNVSVLAKADGKAQHTMKVGTKESKVSVDIVGATTVIDNTGVTTSLDTKKAGIAAGKRFEAVAITDKDGKTITKFRLLNTSNNKEERPEPTLKDGESFPTGSESNITQDSNGTIHIQTTTPKLETAQQFTIE